MDMTETVRATGPVDGGSKKPRAGVCPELLAPAGDWDCAKAAVENGADAIYFGLERFNARMRARNFTEADLPALMEFLHRRGVKGYVTFNTLVFENELAEAEQYARAIIAAGVDAAIVQDAGICRLLRRLSPDFPIHASTQMTITSAAGVEFARELGCELVVLARECSIKEIEKIRSTPEANAMPLEVFVHGALCVAYSGQCLTSEALGGRSANRGECAQACRMPYELVSDGKTVPLGDRRYLLSPQDLSGMEVLPELVRAGVASLKIEGRLKTPEYVANITRAYRRALDAAASPRELERAREETRYDLEMGFSRGLYTGWFRGINNQELAHARFGKKRGVYLGEVTGVKDGRVTVALRGPLKAGDGVVFDAGHPDEREEGGRVYDLETRGRETVLGFGRGDIDFERVRVGDKLWKTSDPELDRRLRQSFAGETPRFRRAIDLEAHGRAAQPMTLLARDELGNVAKAESAMPLAPAGKQPLGAEKLREQLGRLGGTAFELGQLENFLEGSVMLPVSELNRLRREVVAQLEFLRAQPKRWTMNAVAAYRQPPPHLPGPPRGAEGEKHLRSGVQNTPESRPGLEGMERRKKIAAELIVLVRNLEQLEAALTAGAETVYCEFENPRKYRDAVGRFRGWKHQAAGAAIFVAPPRIFKTGEEWILEQVRSCDADGYLARNYDHLKFFKGSRLVGDFSLNVANSLAADHFRNHFGLERVTASYDLNIGQLEALLRGAPADWFEITIHQHMPMFHMEHCVFCAFLSSGTDYRNCGRPCDEHAVQLRDRVGAEHPLKADAGCRNTVFNSQAQTGAEYVGRMLAPGARHFRIEFLNETGAQVRDTMAKYGQLLRGELDGGKLWRELKLHHQLGVTRGQMAG
jgi:U32 family peptidase